MISRLQFRALTSFIIHRMLANIYNNNYRLLEEEYFKVELAFDCTSICIELKTAKARNLKLYTQIFFIQTLTRIQQLYKTRVFVCAVLKLDFPSVIVGSTTVVLRPT